MRRCSCKPPRVVASAFEFPPKLCFSDAFRLRIVYSCLLIVAAWVSFSVGNALILSTLRCWHCLSVAFFLAACASLSAFLPPDGGAVVCDGPVAIGETSTTGICADSVPAAVCIGTATAAGVHIVPRARAAAASCSPVLSTTPGSIPGKHALQNSSPSSSHSLRHHEHSRVPGGIYHRRPTCRHPRGTCRRKQDRQGSWTCPPALHVPATRANSECTGTR